MKLIRNRRNIYALTFAVSACLAVYIGIISLFEAVFVIGAVSLILLLLLVRESRRLSDATLISENRIITVPSAIITIQSRQMINVLDETVVSTFGILVGGKIYRWGLDGVHGTRLNAVRIDKERMYLTFGDKTKKMGVELLHGMTHKRKVSETADKILHETGVTPEITGW